MLLCWIAALYWGIRSGVWDIGHDYIETAERHVLRCARCGAVSDGWSARDVPKW